MPGSAPLRVTPGLGPARMPHANRARPPICHPAARRRLSARRGRDRRRRHGGAQIPWGRPRAEGPDRRADRRRDRADAGPADPRDRVRRAGPRVRPDRTGPGNPGSDPRQRGPEPGQ